MNRPTAYTQELFDCRDKSLVGGKAANLGRLVRAGFPVPDAFVVTTRAYRFAQIHVPGSNGNGNGEATAPTTLPPEIAEEIRRAYAALGGGPVAVRSSATAEDMAAASMAGQYETFLDIHGEDSLLDAVRCCWASLDSPRIRTYLKEHGIEQSRVAMAVLVQRLVSADVAGVLFTANPQTGGRREMLVEASWGLGESVVSGRVQPDVLRLDRETGRVLHAAIADKRVFLPAGAHEERPVEESRRKLPCLRGQDVVRLWELGKLAADHFGSPQDIEWAIFDGELYLLQSRPITTLEEAESYEEILRTTRVRLREQIAGGRGPWALHNLAETLPHPTPLTWSVIERFMTGDGGFGAMYRQTGFEPSAVAKREGFLERIAGRVYMDAARAPEMFFEKFPFAYDLEQLKRSPDASQTPPTLPRGSFRARMRAARKLGAVNAKLRELSADFDRRLNDEIFPAFSRWVAEERDRDLSALSPEELIELWQDRERRVLDDFAPQSLLPSLISGMALAELRTFLEENFWEDDPDDLAQLISSGGPPNRTVIADAELYEVGAGTRGLEKWIADHGHRAAGEFDLASPRWREVPQAVAEMAARLKGGDSPLERHQRHSKEIASRIDSLRSRLPDADRAELDRRVDLVRRYVTFREDGKDFLMLGYDLLRDIALEAGRRLEIGEDVFYLTREDLFDSLRVGFAPHHLMAQRKSAYKAEAKVSLPRVIDAQAVETLGEPAEVKLAGGYKAFAVSSGEATGPAMIRKSPTEPGEMGRGYILVCPSTDPSWTPLFVNAAGLVLECGGTLSHGAVVAREMGLPAVVLPDATRLFQEGEAIRVDGRRGHVVRAADAVADAQIASEEIDLQDVHIPRELIPPPPGRRERRAGKARNIVALAWAVYLLAVFLLPEDWVYQRSLSAMDAFLWPMIRNWGKPSTVAILAAAVAALTMLVQRIATDNKRLIEAKRRVAMLQGQSSKLPKNSPGRSAMAALATSVQFRTLMAAMVPVGLLLGPMVMTFVWLKDRAALDAWNALPDSTIHVVAMVDSDYEGEVTIGVPAGLTIGEPASGKPDPVKKTLERLLALYRKQGDQPGESWEMNLAPDYGRALAAADLQAYLDNGVPPQAVSWSIFPPAGQRGRFPITASAAKGPPVALTAVLGDKFPPSPKVAEGGKKSPIRDVTVSYSAPSMAPEPVFLRPLAQLHKLDHSKVPERIAKIARWLADWDIGWLLLYIAAYLPVLFLFRAVLRVA
ncbi:MAG: hypothetical protein JWL69_2265 [Phycisphaerales bacterium]|nr:hypothetical protein [Phycisphaerales bacterium]